MSSTRKLIAIADTHLHYWKAFATGHGPESSRFRQTLQVLRDSLTEARVQQIPWVHAGDWVHTIGFAHNGILTHLIALLNEFEDVEKITVWGNHDARSHGKQISLDETIVGILSAGVKTLHVLNGPEYGYVARNRLSFYGEGYQPSRQFRVFDNPDTAWHLKFDVGVFHQVVNGSQLASGLQLENDVSGLSSSHLCAAFRLTIVGDVHHPQTFLSGKPVDAGLVWRPSNGVVVPGSPEHHTFGDKDRHGWWVCTIDDAVVCEMVPGKSPEFITVQTAAEVKDDLNFYRVLSPCNASELPKNSVAVAPQPVTVAERGLIKEGASTQEILQAWLGVSPPLGDASKYLEAGRGLLESEGLATVRAVDVQVIYVEHFLCFSNERLALEEGVNLVVGEARDFESNGAGKTSLFEALFWCLFGRTTKGLSADEVIQWGADSCTVELTLWDIANEQEINVRRTRKRGGSGSIQISAGEAEWSGGSAELTKDLIKYLGITPDLFQALAYFSQSKLVLFSQATDSERKAMLADLCGLDVFQKASTAAGIRGRTLESTLTVDRARLKEWEDSVPTVQTQLTDLQAKSGEFFKSIEVEVLNLRQQIVDLHTQRTVLDTRHTAALAELEQQIAASKVLLDGEKQAIRTQLEEQLKKEFMAVQFRYESVPSSTEASKGTQYWRSEIARWEQELHRIEEVYVSLTREQALGSQKDKDLTALILRLEALGDVCPTCRQAIPPELTLQYRTSAIADRNFNSQAQSVCDEGIHSALLKRSEARDGLAEAREYFLASTKLEQAISERDRSLDRLQIQAKDLDSQVERLLATRVSEETHKWEQATARMTQVYTFDVHSNGQASASCGEKIVTLQNQVNPYAALITTTGQQLANLSQKIAEFSSAMRVRDEELAMVNYWASGLSRSGVQSLLLEGVAAEFNQIRSKVFPLLTRGIYDVQFSTVSATSVGEAREKTALIIRDRDALISYDALSGGQRRRIDLGVMLTLALAVSKTRNVPGVLGLLILDEVFGFLDSDGVEALYETLVEIQETIPKIYAITHDPDLQSLFRSTLLVRQDAHGVSTLVHQPKMGE